MCPTPSMVSFMCRLVQFSKAIFNEGGPHRLVTILTSGLFECCQLGAWSEASRLYGRNEQCQ